MSSEIIYRIPDEWKERRQFWYSKYCNCLLRDEKQVYYNLYKAYDDLIKFKKY